MTYELTLNGTHHINLSSAFSAPITYSTSYQLPFPPTLDGLSAFHYLFTTTFVVSPSIPPPPTFQSCATNLMMSGCDRHFTNFWNGTIQIEGGDSTLTLLSALSTNIPDLPLSLFHLYITLPDSALISTPLPPSLILFASLFILPLLRKLWTHFQ